MSAESQNPTPGTPGPTPAPAAKPAAAAPAAAPAAAAAPAPAPAPPPPPDPALVALRELVGRVLGDAATPDPLPGVPAWRVAAADLVGAATRLRDAGFDYLLFMTAVDRPAEGKFELVYLVTRFDDGREVALLTDAPREEPRVPTVSGIWKTADWHEREAFDMFGVVFTGHPFLRRILLDEDWPGHPLRKDYVDTLHDVRKRPS